MLELTGLVAQKDPRRFGRIAARWVFRYLQEAGTASLADVQAVTLGLATLGGPRHDEALLSLRGMAEEATKARAGGAVA